MSSSADSLSATAHRPLTPFSTPVAPSPVGESETVVNPERRGAPVAAASHSMPESGVWRRLFPAEFDSPTEGPAGFELEHFVIEERIGAGGMGAVFRAVDQRLQRVVALKVLTPGQSRDLASVQRFQNEARAAARLDHDNIARVYYVGAEQGLQFIAFEYVTGTNVRELIRQEGRLDPSEAVNYTLQIAAALKHTAAAGVVHRDIKPSNIIIAPNGRAKLVDLGLARKQNSESVGDLTIAGTTLGTFDYISPEQAKDPRNVDVRSDIYSLGCTLYHMLTGEPPYPEGTVLQKLLDHQGGDPPDPVRKNRRVPPNLSAVVQKMMASDPRRRYATPDDLIRDLMIVAAGLGLRGVNPEGLVWSTTAFPRAPFWQRNLGWIATAAVLLAIVVLLDRFPSVGVPRRAQPPASNGSGLALNGAESDPSSRQAPPLPLTGNDSDTSRDVDSTASSNDRDVRTEENGNRPGEPEFSPAESNDRPADDSSLPPILSESDIPFTDTIPRTELRSGEGAFSVSGTLFPEPGELFREPLAPAFLDALANLRPDRLSSGATTETPAETSTTPSAAVAVRPSVSAAEVPAAEPAKGQPAPMPPIGTSPAPEIVVLSGGESRSYTRLEAACSEARDGDVIELRYNGSRGEAESPLKVAGKRLYIRAAKGFRPLIEFAPAEVPSQGYGTRMITVDNGQIDLINVDVRIEIRDDVDLRSGQLWTLFSLQGADSDRVQLQGVTVTVVNGRGQPAALFELASGPSRALAKMQMMGTSEDAARTRFEVGIVDSLLRGGCDLFVVRHTVPGDLSVSRSAVALSGAGLLALGDLETPAEFARLKLRFEHVTALLGNSLINVDTGDLGRRVLPLHVRVQNSLLASTNGTPLVTMTGNTDADDLRALLRWSGENNAYDRFETFWTIASLQGAAEMDAYDFEEWTAAWSMSSDTGEVKPLDAGVAWQNAWWEIEPAQTTPADLQLDRSRSDNPAVGGATDGTSDLGADLSRLPPLLAPPR